MKKLLFVLTLIFTLFPLGWSAPVVLETPTAISANTSTNLALGAFTLPPAMAAGRTGMRGALTFAGTAGATNGTVVVYLVTSADGVTFDTAAQSNIKLTALPGGAGLIQKSEQFQFVGANKIRVGRIENNSNGGVTNVVLQLNYQPN